jgi:hypothetical protein
VTARESRDQTGAQSMLGLHDRAENALAVNMERDKVPT